jgi:hypothetical protein
MSNLTRAMMMGAAGASGDKVYVDDVFSTFLYDATGVAGSINNGIDLAGEGGMVWTKARDGNRDHQIGDTEQGTSYILVSNSNAAASSGSYTAFNSNGYSIGTSSHVNSDAYDYVSWTFRKAPGFFDVVTYAGNDTAGRTIAHSLGSVPGMIIVKETSSTSNWAVWHRSLTSDNYTLLLNLTTAQDETGYFNDTAPTASNFTVSNSGLVNQSGQSYVAYVFAHDDASFGTAGNESIIKCGSYTGTNSSTGPVIDLGFEPQWVMIKKASGAGSCSWIMADTMRGFTVTGESNKILYADAASSENSSSFGGTTATGFQLESSDNSTNGSGEYIYMAIRRPHKPPEAATEVFKPELLSSLTQTSTPGFAPDWVLQRPVRNTSDNSFFVGSRLTGNGKYLATFNANAEGSFTSWKFDAPTGKFSQTLTTGSTSGGIQHFFKRASGFFDVVAYAGNSTSGRTESHNLGVVPEMIWVKGRNLSSQDWAVYHSATGTSKYLKLNNNTVPIGIGRITGISNTTFTLDSDDIVNKSGDPYIAYLFATMPGVSKVGSFSGTGNDLNVDCGFTNGARFVMIKRTDSSGDWYVWDSARGIVAGNDPYVLVNSAAAEVTNTDYIDPLNAGFTVTSSAPAALNNNGGTYIFLAIA